MPQWTLLSLLLFVFSLVLSWITLAHWDFLYEVWYKGLNIANTIQTYGGHNHFKQDFHLTDKAEHLKLFSQIVTAIHHQGTGLDKITYSLPDGTLVDYLLRQPEVVHLQDVAKLVDVFLLTGFACGLISLLLVFMLIKKRQAYPGTLKLTGYLSLFVFLMTSLVLLIGPVKVFYQFHEWVFPSGHQWFFYYQESLMTTLMQAPDLFGCIGFALVVMALIFFTLISVIIGLLFRIVPRFLPDAGPVHN